MDKDSLPRWGWLLLTLFAAAIVSSLVNLFLLFPLGLPESYQSVTTITFMAPVVLYVGVWHDEDRRSYWDHSRLHIVGDVVFTATGALLGSAIVLVAVLDRGFPQLAVEMVAMLLGFVVAWAMFWWRNTDLYRDED